MWKLHAAGHITLMLKAHDKPQLFRTKGKLEKHLRGSQHLAVWIRQT